MVAKQVFDHSLRESGKRFSSSLKASNRYSAAELEYSGVHDLASIDQSVLNHLAASDTLAAQRLRMLLDYATAADPENPGEKVNWLTQYSAWYRYHGTSHRMTEDERERFRGEEPPTHSIIAPQSLQGPTTATLHGRPCSIETQTPSKGRSQGNSRPCRTAPGPPSSGIGAGVRKLATGSSSASPT